MTRSFRKTPIFGNGNAPSDKPFKTAEHQRERRRVKISLGKGCDPEHPKTFGNPWNADKDGKRYWRNAGPEVMRK